VLRLKYKKSSVDTIVEKGTNLWKTIELKQFSKYRQLTEDLWREKHSRDWNTCDNIKVLLLFKNTWKAILSLKTKDNCWNQELMKDLISLPTILIGWDISIMRMLRKLSLNSGDKGLQENISKLHRALWLLSLVDQRQDMPASLVKILNRRGSKKVIPKSKRKLTMEPKSHRKLNSTIQ
jgi:hypothetical protein